MLSVTLGPNVFTPTPIIDFGAYVESSLLKHKSQMFEVTAYIPTGHRTATGSEAVPYFSAAVDPKVVPYGSWLFVAGAGWYRAEDTGDSVARRSGLPVIDICVASESEAYNWGRRPKKVWIVSEGDLRHTISLLIKNGYTKKQIYQYLFSPKFIEAQGSYLTPYHLVELIVDLLPERDERRKDVDMEDPTIFEVSVEHGQEMDIGMAPTKLEMTEYELQSFLGVGSIDPAKWAEIFVQGGPFRIGNVSYTWKRRTP